MYFNNVFKRIYARVCAPTCECVTIESRCQSLGPPRSYRTLSDGSPKLPLDDQITAPRVRVLRDGKFVGDFDTPEALSVAKREGVNLILFRPSSTPPICVLAKYEDFIEQHKPKPVETGSQDSNAVFRFDPSLKVKVVQISAHCAENDFKRKIQSARKFLESGNRVELVVFTKSNRKQSASISPPADSTLPLSFSLENPLIQRVEYIYAQLADVGRPFTLRSKVDLRQRQLQLKFWPI